MQGRAYPRISVIFFQVLVWCAVTSGLATAPAVAGGFPASFVAGDYPTNHFDDNRTGWNPYETTLTTANVNSTSFGPIWQAATDSRVFAQPLVAMAENVLGTTHNVVFVATMNDMY